MATGRSCGGPMAEARGGMGGLLWGGSVGVGGGGRKRVVRRISGREGLKND